MSVEDDLRRELGLVEVRDRDEDVALFVLGHAVRRVPLLGQDDAQPSARV